MATTPLTDAAIKEALTTLHGWERTGDIILKTYAFPSYLAGIAFASAVGTICEGMDHHPDALTITWRKVMVSFMTHDAGSKITAKDIKAAQAIESLGYPKA